MEGYVKEEDNRKCKEIEETSRGVNIFIILITVMVSWNIGMSKLIYCTF